MSGSWLWGSSAPVTEFDRVLENCTSSNLPSSAPPPITDSLALSDLIRSSAVPASHAVKSLRKRLTHSNPNVQLLATTVIDICIKNGGDAFLKEIGARDFSEECAQILTNPSSNREVREKLKKEFQNWALAFEAVSFLSHSELVHNYKRLSSLGIEFPPRDPSATAAMVDSMSAPEWRDSDVCERCRTPFSFTNRKHHCRNCGGVFDAQCSGKRRALAHFGVTEPVRICDGCDRTLSTGTVSATKTGSVVGRRNSFSGENQSHSPTKLSMPAGSHHRSATFHSGAPGRSTHRYTHSTPNQSASVLQSSNREDDDLERAIALSLQELNPSQRAPLISRSLPEQTPAPTFVQGPSKPPEISTTDGDDDPALAAAIAASLRDVENLSAHQPSAPFPASPSEGSRRLPPKPPLPSYELTSEQTNVLYNFSADVDSALQTGSLNPSNPSLRQSHAQAEAIRPLMMRGIENADRKMQLLREMNDKLSGVVRTYDRLLSEQIMYRTQSSMTSGTVDHSRSVYASQQPSYNPSQMAPYYSQPNFAQPMQPLSSNLTSTAHEVPNGPHHPYNVGSQPHAPEARQIQPSVPASEGTSAYNFNGPYHPQAALGNDMTAPVSHQAYSNGPTPTSPLDMRPSPLPHESIIPAEHTQYISSTAPFTHHPQSFATHSEPAKLNAESSSSPYPTTNESTWISQPGLTHYDPQHQELRSVVPGSTYLTEPGTRPISTLASNQELSGMIPGSVEQARDTHNPWSATPDFGSEVRSNPVEEVHASIPITTPSFPSVPNTELRWTHEWEMHGGMQPNRQEEVGPLIEL
ncbi:hypothetical protein DFH28DRAFT_1009123 [Melampsora americana]|nr:hypothetical protein DFH28DRAFT_1009123 [Melampsora americana]